MNPIDAMKAMGDLWGRGAQSFLDAQRSMVSAMAAAAPDGAGSASATPDAASFADAQKRFEQAWSAAQNTAKSFAGAFDGVRQGETDPVTAGLLSKIFDPRGWLEGTTELDGALNRMAEGPRLADLWQVERKLAGLFAAWIVLRRRNLEHSTVMLGAWARATEAFSKAVNERKKAGKPPEGTREMIALWVETANDVLLETQRSEAFLKSQRETLTASTDLRLAQQEVGEFYGEMFGYPTRAELDDVHKGLSELRREVRALARAKPKRPAAKARKGAP